MDRVFQILAVILIGIAAFFFWRNTLDAAFASAVLGAISFFLSIRFQIKDRVLEREAAAREAAEYEDEDPEGFEADEADESAEEDKA